MRPDDAEVGEQFRHQARRHRHASISVDGVRSGAVAFNCLSDELFCQLGTFVLRDDPGRVVSGVDIDQHVQVKPDALRRSAELGDIPGPHL